MKGMDSMSVNYNKAMGYGMPWHRFEELFLSDCQAHETETVLNDIFDDIAPEELTFSIEEAQKIFYKDYTPSILNLCLVNTDVPSKGVGKDFGRSEDLFTTVFGSDDDDPRHIIFFPNLYLRKQWYRRDDVLDITFLRKHQSQCKERLKMIDDIIYLDHGIDLYGYFEMNEHGEGVEIRHMQELSARLRGEELDENLKFYPTIPSEIRWYLKKLNVLDDKGINELRPILAEWYS